jgi:hypothetical protein
MTKRLLKSSLLMLFLALGTCSAAHGMIFRTCGIPGFPPCKKSPEIDPGLAVSALTLLGGTLVVLRARRKK